MFVVVMIHVAYYLIIVLLFGFLIPLLFKMKKWGYFIFVFLSITSAFLFNISLRSLPPSKVEIKIVEPKPGFESDSHIIKVTGTVSVPNCRIYILVHPGQTDQWWIQNLPEYYDSESLKWQAECYSGTDQLGINDTYDIVAVASIDNLFFDVLANRYKYPGQTLKALPLLNKSNIVTIKRNK